MRVAVVTFPGSNCDADAVHVASNLLGVDAGLVWHQDVELPIETGLVILPGGFSYGDALRSGAIARFSPVMAAVRRFAEAGGLVLGICNGFQVLVESGLLPGAMLQNASQKFVCRMVTVEVATDRDTPFTRGLAPGDRLRIPVAHHEGRWFVAPEALARLEAEGQVAFRYLEGSDPNGSVGRVAGILDASRRVLGMMPHPERAAEPILGSDDGLKLFRSAVTSLAEEARG
ncbi:MAG: phosphoribosylformylglycinamidine synthase subunit PurQ [Myxococcota bacterium]